MPEAKLRALPVRQARQSWHRCAPAPRQLGLRRPGPGESHGPARTSKPCENLRYVQWYEVPPREGDDVSGCARHVTWSQGYS